MSLSPTDLRSGLTTDLRSEHAVVVEIDRTQSLVTVGLWAAWLLACLPLLFVRVLPSVDYPDHLARVYILARALDIPSYAQFYHSHWSVLPNLAFDLIMVGLAKILPVTTAGRVFLALVFGITIYGGARLNKALAGRRSWLSLAPALLIFNHVLAYGFINFLFGLGLLLIGLAVHVEQRNAKSLTRIVLETLLLTVLFASHIDALALYVFCAIFLDVGRWLADRPGRRAIITDISVVLAPLLCLLTLLFLLSPTANEASQMEFRPLLLKLRLLHVTLQTGQGVWDTFFGAVLIAFAAWILLSRRARVAPQMWMALGALLVLFLACPTGFKTAMNVDTRIPTVLTILALASLVPSRASNGRLIGACLLALLALRAITTSLSYHNSAEKTEGVMADLRRVPAGSILLVARSVDSNAFDATAWTPPLMHLGCLLLLERPILAQDLFTIPTEQPLLKAPPFDEINLTSKVGGIRARTLEDFGRQAAAEVLRLKLEDRPGYLYYVRGSGIDRTPPELKPVIVRDRYAIYRLDTAAVASDKLFGTRTSEDQGSAFSSDPELWTSVN